MLELVRDARRRADAARARRRRAASARGHVPRTGRDGCVYLEREKGAKPSTLRDYRWVLAEPGQAHRRGRGRSPGLLMAAFGDRAATASRRVTSPSTSAASTAPERARTVNKHRQVISAIYGYAMREDTYGLAANPPAATTQAARAATGRPRLLRARGGRGARPRCGARAPTGGDEAPDRRGRGRGARRGGPPGRRAVPDRGVHRSAPRRTACTPVGRRRPRDRRLVVHRALSDRVEGPTKSWQARFVPIADPAAAGVRTARRAQRFIGPDDYVFCSRLGRPLDGSALRRRFKRAAAAAGLRVLRFHALRHGAGSLVAREADPRWVQGFLGHSKLTTTARYLHAKARPEDVDRLNRAFAMPDVDRQGVPGP